MEIGQRLAEERKRIPLGVGALAEACGVTRDAQRKYERGDNLPGGAYLEAAARNKIDIQYVLTGFRASEVPGAREFMERMDEAGKRVRNTWRTYTLPEDEKLFMAMQGVRAIPGATDGHTAALAQAFKDLLNTHANASPAQTANAVTPAVPVAQPVHVDERLLKDCVAGIEEHLALRKRRMQPGNKAALVVEVYMHFLEEEQRESKRASRTNVVEFIRRRAA